MSLQVWLPLNGNVNNQGLNGKKATESGTAVDGGKLGKCYNFNGTNNAITIPLTTTDHMTFCCWVYLNALGNYHLLDARYAYNNYGNGKGYQPIYISAAGIIQNGSGQGSTDKENWPNCTKSPLQAKTWYHIAVTYTPTECECFVNGVSVNKTIWDGFGQNFGDTTLYIGSRFTGGNKLNGKVNDVRVYDHVLSLREIKELRKCLAVHYRLCNDNDLAGYHRLEYIQSNGNAYIDTEVVQTNDTAIDLHIYNNSPEKNYLFGARQNSGTMIYNGMYNNNSLEYNWITINYTASNDVYMYQNVVGNTNTIVINDQTFTAATGTADANNIFIFACNNATVRYYGTMRVYFFRIKQGGQVVRDFIPVLRTSDNKPGLLDMVSHKFFTSKGSGEFTYGEQTVDSESDCSGNGNHGINMASRNYVAGGPRYLSYENFGGTGYFKMNKPFQRSNGESLAVSVWFYQTDRTGYQDLVVNRDNSGYNWMLYLHNDDGSIQLHGNEQYKSSIIPALNAWHHVAASVHTNSTYDLYLDGQKVVSGQSYLYHADSPSNATIGAFGIGNEIFKGKMSDVRIYGSDLTDAEVIELYNTGAKIYKDGTMACYGEFIEV